jgi:hypothetical protein
MQEKKFMQQTTDKKAALFFEITVKSPHSMPQ